MASEIKDLLIINVKSKAGDETTMVALIKAVNLE